MNFIPQFNRRLVFAGSATALGLIGLAASAQTPATAPAPQLPDAAAQAAPEAAAQPGARGGGRGGITNEDADFTPKAPILPRTPAEEMKAFVMPPGYRMELVASDPDINQPVFVEFDGNGRMYVGEMRTYMLDSLATGEFDLRNRISRWESTKGDGVFDKHTVFVDNIAPPRAVLTLDKDRILVNETHSDNLDLYTDTNGDGVADKKEVFYTGVGLGRDGNIEHEQSGFLWAMDNWIYSTYNTFRFRWTPTGIIKETIPNSGGQWGLTQDNDGKTWNVNAGGETGPVAFQIPVQYGIHDLTEGMETDFATVWPLVGIYDQQGGMRRARIPLGTLNHFTASTGPDIFRGTALPDDLKGDLLFTEPVGRLVRRTKIVKTEGITQLRNAYPYSEFILNSDPLFRPVNLRTAPDGSVYLVDMYHGIIQESQWSAPGTYLYARVQQYALDKVVGLGRIWRLRYDGIPSHTTDTNVAGKPAIPLNLTQPRMLGETAAQLVAHLSDPNGWWRDTAQRLLVLKQDKSVVPVLQEMVRGSGDLQGRMHALWVLEGLGAMPAALVREEMKDASARMRVQAIRASETLYKAGDRSFEADYRALMRDADTDVAIQALITGNVLKIKDISSLAKDVLPKSAQDAKLPKGVTEFATWISNGAAPGGRGGGGAVAAGTPAQQALIAQGTQVFTTLCFSCHGSDGRGTPVADGAPGSTMAPPLATSPRVQGHRDYIIKALLNGVTGPIDGKTYTDVMIPMGGMADDAIAGVASYVRNSFGNSSGYVTAADVARVRAANTRTTPWTVAALSASLPTVFQADATWKLSASSTSTAANANPQNAINLTGWTLPGAGRGNAAGAAAANPSADWLQVELPASVTLAEIQFNSGGGGRGGGGARGGARGAGPGRGAAPVDPNTAAAAAAAPGGAGDATAGAPAPAPAPAAPARQYGLQVSANGTAWTNVDAQSRNEGSLTMLTFKPTPARFVRITSSPTGAAPAAWTVTNLRLFQAGR